jgi:hypothetical protein
MEPTQRRNAVARAVLLWLYDEDENYPLVEDFLELPASDVSGGIVSNDELVRTVRWLDDRGLIDGLRIDQVPYPVSSLVRAFRGRATTSLSQCAADRSSSTFRSRWQSLSRKRASLPQPPTTAPD